MAETILHWPDEAEIPSSQSTDTIDPAALRAHAQLFGRERYRRRMAEEVERALDDARLGAGVSQGPAPLRRVDVSSPSAPPKDAEIVTTSASDLDSTSVETADPKTPTTERARHASTQR